MAPKGRTVSRNLRPGSVDVRRQRLREGRSLPGEAAVALHPQNDKIRATLHSKLAQQVRDMKLDGALGDEKLRRNFFVRQIIQQQVQHLMFAPADSDLAVERFATLQFWQDGLDKAGQHFARNPISAVGDL